ncbi:hypothetical protein [Lentzea californiensis]|uniref:hypothetical protein n=1 Tax=Lentzea californiensis TaxID=438851 RepID=UPI002165AA23|nr:hypothetical protein [Lentzea californiensis]
MNEPATHSNRPPAELLEQFGRFKAPLALSDTQDCHPLDDIKCCHRSDDVLQLRCALTAVENIEEVPDVDAH